MWRNNTYLVSGTLLSSDSWLYNVRNNHWHVSFSKTFTKVHLTPSFYFTWSTSLFNSFDRALRHLMMKLRCSHSDRYTLWKYLFFPRSSSSLVNNFSDYLHYVRVVFKVKEKVLGDLLCSKKSWCLIYFWAFYGSDNGVNWGNHNFPLVSYEKVKRPLLLSFGKRKETKYVPMGERFVSLMYLMAV